jgi:hypothetical protein
MMSPSIAGSADGKESTFVAVSLSRQVADEGVVAEHERQLGVGGGCGLGLRGLSLGGDGERRTDGALDAGVEVGEITPGVVLDRDIDRKAHGQAGLPAPEEKSAPAISRARRAAPS